MSDSLIARLPENIRFDLKGPCGDCPFRKNVAFHQGIAKNLPETISALDRGTLLHTCHCTDPIADGFRPRYKGPIQHCGGLLAMMAKDASLLGILQLRALEDGRWKPELMQKRPRVFESMPKLVQHYYEGLKNLKVERARKRTSEAKP